MPWSDLIRHPYITTDPRAESPDDVMHLSYSVEHGRYLSDNMIEEIS